jgi:hypothetical protein
MITQTLVASTSYLPAICVPVAREPTVLDALVRSIGRDMAEPVRVASICSWAAALTLHVRVPLELVYILAYCLCRSIEVLKLAAKVTSTLDLQFLGQTLHQICIAVVLELEILDEVVFVFPVTQYDGPDVLVAVACQFDAALIHLLVWRAEELVPVVVAHVVVWRADFAILDFLLHHAKLVAILRAVGFRAAVVCVEAVLDLTLVGVLDVGCEIHTEEVVPRTSL